MKRLLLSLALIITTAANFAQSIPKMELKPNGFVSAADSTKNYVVLEVPKVKQAELYKKTLTYLNGFYKNPSQVISAVDGESITVNGITNEIKGSIEWYKYPMEYNIMIQFKDGKMKVSPKIISLNEIWSESKPARKIYLKNTDSPKHVEISCIYMQHKVGYFLFLKELKESLDSWANGYTSGITKNLSDNW